jgi:hypothetical protein
MIPSTGFSGFYSVLIGLAQVQIGRTLYGWFYGAAEYAGTLRLNGTLAFRGTI